MCKMKPEKKREKGQNEEKKYEKREEPRRLKYFMVTNGSKKLIEKLSLTIYGQLKRMKGKTKIMEAREREDLWN